MLKRYFSLLSLLLFFQNGTAQKNDAVWFLGMSYSFFVPALDFYYGSPDTIGIQTPVSFYGRGNSSMCDSAGNLLFYSNGTALYNKFHQPVPGSNGFNYNTLNSQDQTPVISLPFPGHPHEYFVFHMNIPVYNNILTMVSTKVYYTHVDMNANAGAGQVSGMNQTLFNDSLSGAFLQAVKHANGRDWWIINHTFNNDNFYISLLTPNGIDTTFIQNVTTGFPIYYNYGQTFFSPDGTLLATTTCGMDQALLFNFNRCTGVFGLNTILTIPPVFQTSTYGCTFSPNSQYLYLNNNHFLYQFDVTAPNIQLSRNLIAQYDGFIDGQPTVFYSDCSGPDNKIYINSTGGSRYLHVINAPDNAGTACNFIQHQLKTKGQIGSSLPLFPNYRLGALTGSPCDTIPPDTTTSFSHITDDHFYFNIYPNPVNDKLFISSSKPGSLTIELCDMTGRKINTIYKGNYTNETITYNMKQFSQGTYFMKLYSESCSENRMIIRE